MTILSDSEITELCQGETPMLFPFTPTSIRKDGNGRKLLSYGVSSYGYDCRLTEKVKIFSNVNGGIIDPKKLDESTLVDAVVRTDEDGSKYAILPPNSYMLGCTVETFHMPRDVISICLGKSTMARSSALVNVTPIEPGFIGQVVIEIGNGCSLPIKIYLNEGIAQFLFFRGNKACDVSYGDRRGKYQNQTGITLPKV